MGILYEYGRGVNKDYNKAALLYQKAAKQGIAEAQFNTGVFYAGGKGGVTDGYL